MSFATACPDLFRSHRDDEWRIQGLCDDRLADRLCGRPGGTHQAHENDSKPEHLESLQHLAGSRNCCTDGDQAVVAEMVAAYKRTARLCGRIGIQQDRRAFECRAGEKARSMRFPAFRGRFRRNGLAGWNWSSSPDERRRMSLRTRQRPLVRPATCGCPSPARWNYPGRSAGRIKRAVNAPLDFGLDRVLDENPGPRAGSNSAQRRPR